MKLQLVVCSTLVSNSDVLAIEFLCCSEWCLVGQRSALQKSYKEHFNELELCLKEALTPTEDLLLLMDVQCCVCPEVFQCCLVPCCSWSLEVSGDTNCVCGT